MDAAEANEICNLPYTSKRLDRGNLWLATKNLLLLRSHFDFMKITMWQITCCYNPLNLFSLCHFLSLCLYSFSISVTSSSAPLLLFSVFFCQALLPVGLSLVKATVGGPQPATQRNIKHTY